MNPNNEPQNPNFLDQNQASQNLSGEGFNSPNPNAPLTPDSNRYADGWNDPKSPAYNPNLTPAGTMRPIHPAYGAQRLVERPLNTNPSHQPHECCGRIFQSKSEFDAHFAATHVPFTRDGQGSQIANPSYIAPENANVGQHQGLPMAEHRAGSYGERGFSTGLAATEKYIPVPESVKPYRQTPEQSALPDRLAPGQREIPKAYPPTGQPNVAYSGNPAPNAPLTPTGSKAATRSAKGKPATIPYPKGK